MTAWPNGLPTSDVTRVRSKSPPTLIWAAAGTAETPRAARPATARVSRRFIVVPPLVRERPDPEIVLHGAPARGQAVRLEDQEEDDEQPEEPLPDGCERADEPGRHAGQGGEDEAQELGEQGHEHGAEDRPEHRA